MARRGLSPAAVAVLVVVAALWPSATAIAADPLQQEITISLPETVDAGATVPLEAVADSGLPVTVESATPETCSVADGVLVPLAPGICTVGASQAGDELYAAAPDVQASTTIQAAVLLPRRRPSPSRCRRRSSRARRSAWMARRIRGFRSAMSPTPLRPVRSPPASSPRSRPDPARSRHRSRATPRTRPRTTSRRRPRSSRSHPTRSPRRSRSRSPPPPWSARAWCSVAQPTRAFPSATPRPPRSSARSATSR